MKTACLTAMAVWMTGAGFFPAARLAAKEAQHLLVQLAYEDGQFRVVQTMPVTLPLPKNRDGSQAGDWRVTLADDKGRMLFQTRIPDPRLVRAELEPPGEEPVRKVIILEGRVDFSLRLPALAGSLRFEQRVVENGKAAWKPLGGCDLPAGEARP